MSREVETSPETTMQGYKNPITGNVEIQFVKNQTPRKPLQTLKHFVQFPIKLSKAQTKKEYEKIVNEEAEDLWDPESLKEG
jgi:hypothetical protein